MSLLFRPLCRAPRGSWPPRFGCEGPYNSGTENPGPYVFHTEMTAFREAQTHQVTGKTKEQKFRGASLTLRVATPPTAAASQEGGPRGAHRTLPASPGDARCVGRCSGSARGKFTDRRRGGGPCDLPRSRRSRAQDPAARDSHKSSAWTSGPWHRQVDGLWSIFPETNVSNALRTE